MTTDWNGLPAQPERMPMAFTICLPWHLRFMSASDYGVERSCTACGRSVAAPERAASVTCLYCAMEYGAVTMIEPGAEVDIRALPPCFRTNFVNLYDLVDTIA